ncbi:hypothetical protein TNCV_5117611 [Trichonephila clavipes]|nr:hypothetical protein TNCV_5117611 [Trichonephila clavipes]
MLDISEVKTGMVIGVHFVEAFMSRTAKRVLLKDHFVRGSGSLHKPGYNVRDEYPPSGPCIHENYSTGVACCEHSLQSSYSKSVSFGTECYKETTVGPGPPKLGTTAIETKNEVRARFPPPRTLPELETVLR